MKKEYERLLEQYIRHLIIEDEELLKKWAKSYTPIEKELIKFGAVPIPRMSNDKADSYVGAGIANIVYEVLYEGKRCVARLSEDLSEYTSLKQFMYTKDDLDKKYTKHYPTVYKYINFRHPMHTKNYYGAIIEILEPLNNQERMMLGYKGSHKKYDNVSLSILEPDSKTITKMLDDYSKDETNRKDIISVYRKIYNRILNKDDKKHISTFVIHLNDSELMKELNRLSRPFVDTLKQLIMDSAIPQEIADDDDEYEYDISVNQLKIMRETFPDKNVRDFCDFLLELNTTGGVSIKDLHDDNFMKRKNGTFVIVDPGFFKYKD